ncbi:uncharacterized protein LOC128559700 [Mercenaria mercenaria]|uniref:uncharacterized protein LOC128559700 n=1 Tax=Mercenaria mercenaria TaxID=6596 RepID=UPI00234E414E|nr:uncharacterized protein LOC128559700 [Mercenaria mercenaria]
MRCGQHISTRKDRMLLLRNMRRLAVALPLIVLSVCFVYWKMTKTIGLNETGEKLVKPKLQPKNIALLKFHPMEFEPEVREDIQTVDTYKTYIPHIIHFIFISGLKGKVGIPGYYKDNVNSFLHFNPNWKYYFWTDISARQLIATRHPTLLPTWDNYPLVIKKADALRYVLLYEFGGVYADLDMKCMRPLDRATMKYACILTPEPFEHSTILYRLPFLLSNAFMMCRPKHPFMKQAILSLPVFANSPHPSAVAGPLFLTTMFKKYNNFQPGDEFRKKTDNVSNSPFFYKGSRAEDHVESIYIANTHYFMDSIDTRVDFQRMCEGPRERMVKRGCFIWTKRKFGKTRKSFSYTDHNWAHIYSINNSTRMIPIESVIPGSKLKIWQAEHG